MIPLLRRPRILLAFLLFFAIWPLRTWASGWVASVDERNGLPTLMRGGSPAVTTTFSFFGRSWDWTYRKPNSRPTDLIGTPSRVKTPRWIST